MIFFKKKYLHNSLKNSIFVEQSMYTQPASQPASLTYIYARNIKEYHIKSKPTVD